MLACIVWQKKKPIKIFKKQIENMNLLSIKIQMRKEIKQLTYKIEIQKRIETKQ